MTLLDYGLLEFLADRPGLFEALSDLHLVQNASVLRVESYESGTQKWWPPRARIIFQIK